MKPASRYFTLSLDSLRAIGSWAADCAERALAVYERHAATDVRPRAIERHPRVCSRRKACRAVAFPGAPAAHAAAREVGDPAAAAAARAAVPPRQAPTPASLVDVHQTKHIVGPAAYAALALELDCAGDTRVSDDAIRWAIAHAPAEIRRSLAADACA
ncbi:MAG: hypothetical protein U0074_05125 [Kouleothrix sp.]